MNQSDVQASNVRLVGAIAGMGSGMVLNNPHGKTLQFNVPIFKV